MPTHFQENAARYLDKHHGWNRAMGSNEDAGLQYTLNGDGSVTVWSYWYKTDDDTEGWHEDRCTDMAMVRDVLGY